MLARDLDARSVEFEFEGAVHVLEHGFPNPSELATAARAKRARRLPVFRIQREAVLAYLARRRAATPGACWQRLREVLVDESDARQATLRFARVLAQAFDGWRHQVAEEAALERANWRKAPASVRQEIDRLTSRDAQAVQAKALATVPPAQRLRVQNQVLATYPELGITITPISILRRDYRPAPGVKPTPFHQAWWSLMSELRSLGLPLETAAELTSSCLRWYLTSESVSPDALLKRWQRGG